MAYAQIPHDDKPIPVQKEVYFEFMVEVHHTLFQFLEASLSFLSHSQFKY
jgi:hypothetical protein